jgi:predicted transcriptional regulator
MNDYRGKIMTKRTKVTVMLSDESLDALEFLAEAGGVTKTAALCRAIKVYGFLQSRMAQGQKVLIRDEVKDTCREILFP